MITVQILLLLPGVRLTTRRPDSTRRVWWRPSPTCIPKASSTETSNQRTLYWTAGATPSWWDGSLGISHVKRENDESRSAPFVAAARESADIWRALSGKTKVCSAHYISTLEVSRVLWFLGRCHLPPPPTNPPSRLLCGVCRFWQSGNKLQGFWLPGLQGGSVRCESETGISVRNQININWFLLSCLSCFLTRRSTLALPRKLVLGRRRGRSAGRRST